MTQECLPGQKETTKKYGRIARMDQARMIQAVQSGQTQVAVAEENNVSRTTLEYWIKRMNELKCRHDPEVTAFFESPAGIAFLHRLLIAALLIFHTNGGSGLPSLHLFLQMIKVSGFIGSSVGTLHKMSNQIDELLKQFDQSERKRMNLSHYSNGLNSSSFPAGGHINFWAILMQYYPKVYMASSGENNLEFRPLE
jgi:hypothetical protein